jgi:uncharacterized Ntn-hydrolase superfamily protein
MYAKKLLKTTVDFARRTTPLSSKLGSFITKEIITGLLLMVSSLNLFSQDTFSIVAIDSLTGEIGSAGASCVGSSSSYPRGAQILSDVIPGIGAIHTQASWLSSNQQHAHNWMIQGLSPQNIIDSLIAKDAGNNPSIRQYGIVDYNGGHPRSAAYTGVNCMSYKNHSAHFNYSIQGNILAGQKILDSMEARFLSTPGDLADRLMAALQGAKVVGADTRCGIHNTSSQSSFLRVARMNNQPDSLYLDLYMAYPTNQTGIFPVDPIDSLQTLYDAWKLFLSVKDQPGEYNPYLKIVTGPGGNVSFDFSQCRGYAGVRIEIFDLTGRIVAAMETKSQMEKLQIPGSGMLIYRILDPKNRQMAAGKFFLPADR